MKIHREGRLIIGAVLLGGTAVAAATYYFIPGIFAPVVAVCALLLLTVLQFFRHPDRPIPQAGHQLVYAPADGKVVVVEETYEAEFFKDRRLMVSIFMSPVNVHVNRSPISGEVRYTQYHPGKYLVAWHPKSSTENERHTVVIGNESGEILVRQIAGALARRIRNYLSTGETVEQGEEIGFIKFGSRVDIFLPLDTTIKVHLGDVVKGNKTLIAEFGG
jgi:phosphatidylserine decarboxylase